MNINHNLPLFLASIIGFSNAGVNSNAVAQFDPSTTIPPGFTIPLALYCNNPSGCTGQISVPQTHTVRRYCGNYFANGPSGNACGSSIADGEIFAVGITFDDNNSTADFRDQVRDGYNQSVSMNQSARSLPGQRNGWRDGMIDRLAQGRNKVILPVIREATVSVGKYNMEVVDFVYVQVSNFTLMGKSDQTTFTIIPGVVPADGFPGNPSGTPINSVSTVRLIQ